MKPSWKLVTLFLPFVLWGAGAHAHPLRFVMQTGIPRQSVQLASEITDWGARPISMSETSPGRYELELEEPWLHKIRYKFVVEGQWVTDPLNPTRVDDGHGGSNSVIRTQRFREDPLLELKAGVPAPSETTFELTDLEGDRRAIRVVRPARAPRAPLVAYFQDGGDYLERTGAGNLLANLSAQGGKPAIVGVFIAPKVRIEEYGLGARSELYMRFVAEKVVPETEKRFGITGSRQRRLVIGPSLGGLVSVATALRHPEVFGLAASQSGAFWYADKRIIDDLARPNDKGLRLFLDAGKYESPAILDTNREAATAAERAGIAVRYREYPSTHDWIAWRNRLQEILRWAAETGR